MVDGVGDSPFATGKVGSSVHNPPLHDDRDHVLTDPGWFPDPLEKHHLRYFDGDEWTDHVTHHGPEPCTDCHLGVETSGPLSAVEAIIERRKVIEQREAPTDITRRRPAPDRRRVRGREDPSRR